MKAPASTTAPPHDLRRGKVFPQQHPRENGRDDRLQARDHPRHLRRELPYGHHTGRVREHGRDHHDPAQQERRGHLGAAQVRRTAEQGPVHLPRPADGGQHHGPDQQSVRDHPQRIRRVRRVLRTAPPVTAPLVRQDEVADLAAGRGEREQDPHRVEAQPGPDLDHTGQAAHREHDPDGGGAGDGPPLHEADPEQDEGGGEVFDEQRDTDGDTGERGEVERLDVGHGQQPESGEQRGPAADQVAVAPGHRKHEQGRAG